MIGSQSTFKNGPQVGLIDIITYHVVYSISQKYASSLAFFSYYMLRTDLCDLLINIHQGSFTKKGEILGLPCANGAILRDIFLL